MGCTIYQIFRAGKILRSDGIPIYPDLSQNNQKRASLCQKGWIFEDSSWKVVRRTPKIPHFVIGRLRIRFFDHGRHEREYQIYSTRTNHVWGMNGFSRSQSHPAFSSLSNIQRSLFRVWGTKLSILSLFIGPMCTWGPIIGSPCLYLLNVFETLWRPSEDYQCCQCCEDLANED